MLAAVTAVIVSDSVIELGLSESQAYETAKGQSQTSQVRPADACLLLFEFCYLLILGPRWAYIALSQAPRRLLVWATAADGSSSSGG